MKFLNRLVTRYGAGMCRRTMVLSLMLALSQCGGKLLTEGTPPGETTAEPMENPASIMAAFARGDEFFARIFKVSDGLGPTFNQPSCETCHPGDGRGTPQTALIRFSINGDLVPRLGGPQLQDKGIPGVNPETIPTGAEISVRMPPPVFGRGLMEAVPAETIIALEDPDDSNGDGISGRVNWVQPAEFVPAEFVGSGPGLAVGRFGLKANISSLLHQVVGAYRDDMGITSDFLAEESIHPDAGDLALTDRVPDPEIPASEVLDVLMYIRTLAVPNRGEITDQVRAGEALFHEVGCVSCHVPSLRTGPNAIPSLDEVDAPLYSDLLLHDMGPTLADNRADGSADGFEWRTPPLMGIRLAPDNLGGIAHYLHDGRTSDLGDAISAHGGEAQGSRDRYQALSVQEQEALVAFVLSL
jgi:CxxC motif-containing protein (DUF1111 family)